MGVSVGWWDSCSGCSESNEGYYDPKYYPPHPKHGVPRGGGCDECKGKGVVFHPFTKADAEELERELMKSE